jgi:preprotein translocase subunit YajC
MLAKGTCIHTLIGSFIIMNLSTLGAMLALGQPTTPGTTPDPRGQALYTVLMLVIMIVMFYFVLIRPQSKKAKDHAEMLKDKVITSGGVVGVVVTVKEKTLSIRSADSKFEVTKAAITEITERSGAPSEA